MSRKPLRHNGFIVGGIIAIAICVMGLSTWAQVPESPREGAASATVVVTTGDTLWSIARRMRPQMDPRKTVYQIKELNDLASVNLFPGQVLMVPLDQ